MRTNVVFSHPHEFVPVSDEDGILSVQGARWFVEILRRVPNLKVQNELRQEDWGVVIFVERNGLRFWIGISLWPDGEHGWLAHFHHHSFALLQRFSASGKASFNQLILDVHEALKQDPAIQGVTWFEESEMRRPDSKGFSQPA